MPDVQSLGGATALVGLPVVGELGRLGEPPDTAKIRSDAPGSCALHVWHERHPALLAQLRDIRPYTRTA